MKHDFNETERLLTLPEFAALLAVALLIGGAGLLVGYILGEG